MESRNFSSEIHKIMESELGEMGEFFIKKQCLELGIMPTFITTRDIPKLSLALSEAMGDFGQDKSTRVVRDMRQLMRSEQAVPRHSLSIGNSVSQASDESKG